MDASSLLFTDHACVRFAQRVLGVAVNCLKDAPALRERCLRGLRRLAREGRRIGSAARAVVVRRTRALVLVGNVVVTVVTRERGFGKSYLRKFEANSASW